MKIALEIVLFVVLLSLSAFFSGAEAAFFSLKDSNRKQHRINSQVSNLLTNPRRLLITILTGYTIVNSAMAFFAAIITADIALSVGANLPLLLIAETIILSIVILLVSEITPKILALRNSEAFANKIALPIRIFGAFLFPLAALLYKFTHIITSWIPHEKEELFDSEDELRTLADLGADRGTLKDEERRMIKSVFDLDETLVREIMVPRIDIIGMEQMTSVRDAIEIIRQNRFSKFPLFEDSIDKIRGILYAKDVLPYINSNDNNGIKLTSLMRKPFFVPETKQIDDLLKDFQERRENIAIVVDEFGGTGGLVTVEDIVEEVVGEIHDEFDEEARLLHSLGNGRWLVDAKTTINDLVDEIPIDFPDDREYDTLGGFMFEQFGDIPNVEDVTEYQNYSFRVKSLAENRILKIVLTKMENVDESR